MLNLRMCISLLVLLTVASQSPTAMTQSTPSAQPAQTPPPCAAPEHRQFDFWIGDWEVRNPAGQVAGVNRIEAIENGCGLQENWTGTGGGSGRSLNFFNPLTRQWHQTWVGVGAHLLLDGRYDGEKMVLEGEALNPRGAKVKNRITWSRLPEGRVRQHWQQSLDDGKTWTTAFDGLYSRRPRP